MMSPNEKFPPYLETYFFACEDENTSIKERAVLFQRIQAIQLGKVWKVLFAGISALFWANTYISHFQHGTLSLSQQTYRNGNVRKSQKKREAYIRKTSSVAGRISGGKNWRKIWPKNGLKMA